MKKTLLIVVLSFGLAQAAYAARCDLDTRTGLPIPSEEPGVCLVESEHPVALVQRTSAGLLVVRPTDGSTDYEQRQHGDVWALVAPETPADFIFCPSSLLEGPLRLPGSDCLGGDEQAAPGYAAFVGSGSFSITSVLGERGAADCPTLLHATGSVVGPGGDRFALSNSLILSPIDVGCGVSYDELDLAFVPQSQFDAQQAETIKSLPAESIDALDPIGTVGSLPIGQTLAAMRNAVGDADPAILQAKANSGKGGIPEVLRQLAVLDGKLEGIDGELEVINAIVQDTNITQRDIEEHTANRPFDVSAAWCFEATPKMEIGIGEETKGTFEADGSGGAEIHGTGVKGAVKLGSKGGLDFSFGAEVDAPKLVICVEGAVSKNTGNLGEIRRNIISTVDASQQRIRERLPDLIETVDVSGENLEAVLTLLETTDLDLSNPADLVGEGVFRSFLANAIAAMPLNTQTRGRLQELAAILENIGTKLQVCDEENLDSLPDAIKDTLMPICSDLEGKDLKTALSTGMETVETIEGAITCRQDTNNTHRSCHNTCNNQDPDPPLGVIELQQCRKTCDDNRATAMDGCAL